MLKKGVAVKGFASFLTVVAKEIKYRCTTQLQTDRQLAKSAKSLP